MFVTLPAILNTDMLLLSSLTQVSGNIFNGEELGKAWDETEWFPGTTLCYKLHSDDISLASWVPQQPTYHCTSCNTFPSEEPKSTSET